jgi:hypothetical protein
MPTQEHKQMTEKTDYQAMLKSMPYGDFDPLTHTTPGSLWAIALHELDLFMAGDDSDIPSKLRAQVQRRWLTKWQEYGYCPVP